MRARQILCAMAWTVAGTLLVAGGCTSAKDAPDKREAPAGNEDSARPSQPEAKACTSAADCQTCSTERECGCVVQPAGRECPPTIDSCFVSPCQWLEAECRPDGQCAVLPAHGPCRADSDCEARRNPYRCEYIAVRKGAPPASSGLVVKCAGMPALPDVRCDTANERCVVGGASSPETTVDRTPLHVRWSCETRGTAITSRTIEVDETPPTIVVTTHEPPTHRKELEDADLHGLRRILATKPLAAFADESPPPGPAHPGMEQCSLEVTSPTITVEAKTWRSSDEYSKMAAAGRQALAAELSALAKKAQAQ